MKINLVIQTAFLGDLILTVPFLKKIKELYPDQALWIVCKKGLGSFLKEAHVIDGYIEVEKKNSHSYQLALQQLAQLEVINLWLVHRSLRSLLWTRKVKAHNKVGYKSFLGKFILDRLYSYEKSWPDVLRKFILLDNPETQKQLQLIDKKDFLNFVDENGRMVDPPEYFSFKRPELWLQLGVKKQVCLFPGSVWATKKWTEDGFIKVGQWLSQKGYNVLLMGSKDEFEICLRISKLIPNSLVKAGDLTISQTLMEVAQSHLVVANDSAATHMASWMGTSVVTMFGPTIPQFGFRPWISQSRVMQIKNLDCRPCGAHGPQICPKGHHRCMNEISPERVIQGIVDLLKIP